MKKISTLLYYLLILFLAYVLMNKILNISSFQTNLIKTGIFNELYSKLMSYLVIILESIVLMLLLFKKKIGLGLFLLMITVFSIYIIYLYVNDSYEICGCGGILNGLSFYKHITINLILILVSFYLKEYEN